MRILIYSHPPYAQTGFGTVIRNLHRHLAKEHEVFILPIVCDPSQTIKVNDAIILSAPGPLEHSWKWVKHWVEELHIDLVIQHFDIWMLKGGWIKEISCPVITYAPVDCTPLPDGFIETTEGAKLNIAMSKFAEDHFLANNMPCRYIPHGVDLELFNFVEGAKKQIFGDGFIVGIFSTNGSIRKNIAGQMQAFKIFSENAPDAKLYMHMQSHKSTPDSIDIYRYAVRLGIENKIITPNPMQYAAGIPDSALPQLYSGIDVMLQCSLGEGFGLPILEAQACGVPVIGTQCSAITEIIGNGGITISEGVPITFAYSLSSMFMPQPKAIAAALYDVYASPFLRNTLAVNALNNAQQYSWEKLWPLWDDALASCF